MGALDIIREQLPKFLEEDQAEGFKGVLDTVLPQDLTDVALMIAGGPWGKAIKAGGLALAGASYSPEAEAARFPWMTMSKIRQLLNDSAYTMDGQRAKSALTMVRPSEMVGATTTGAEHRAKILQEAGRYDPYRQQTSGSAYLEVDPVKGQFMEHEGRHRMTGAKEASGSDAPLPYEISLPNGRAASINEMKALEGRRIKGQKYSGEKIGSPVTLREITPLAYDTPEEELLKYVRDIDVPLKNVGINLKPQGPGFTDYDKSAYHNPVPYGKIPPPEPYFTAPWDALKGARYREALELWTSLPAEERAKHKYLEWFRQFYPDGVK